MGGKSDNPTYEEVCEGYTNHVEVVELQYDQTIDLNQILNIFFTVHDPTSINRQGADVGTQYRSGVFCKPEERSSIVNYIQELESQGIIKDKIVTEVNDILNFFVAEDYLNANILGVDLSIASLAYAKRKTDESNDHDHANTHKNKQANDNTHPIEQKKKKNQKNKHKTKNDQGK